ncbi:low affinity immunoglobulin epsilon Fc receptor-like [Argopecten irradians]|uniref:low affinity immunoglobulin epsilon Fc receptor-like n=1 Tax=Argopecten irradians TaxID=31199 RepID=UPI0037197AA5
MEVCVNLKSGDYTCHRLDVCPSHEWVPFNGKCYYFDGAKFSADENDELCEGLEAKPVRVDNEEVYSFLRSELSRRDLARVWIGANDKDVEGEWVWGPGEPVSFTGWRNGEPNSNNGDEDCVIMKRSGWVDISCSMKLPSSACETSYKISTLSTYTTLEP